MKTNDFVSRNVDIKVGNGFLTEDYIFNNVSEDLFKFVGADNANASILGVIDDSCKAELVSILEATRESYEPQKGVFLFKRADGICRWMFVYVAYLDRQKGFELEISDIINCFDLANSNQANVSKYQGLLELVGTTYFEHEVDTQELNVYYIEGSSEITVNSIYLEEWKTDVFDNKELGAQDKVKCLQLYNSLLSGEKEFDYSFKFNVFAKNFSKGNITIRATTISEGIGSKRVNKVIGFIVDGASDNAEANHYLNATNLDLMTGLLNRRDIVDFACDYIEDKQYDQIIIIMFNLDNFRLINENFGTMFGDDVIKKAANILKKTVGNRGAVGRLDGDEFFIIMHDIGAEGDVRAVLGSIMSQVEGIYSDKLKGFNLSCSMGISQYPKNGKSLPLLFKKADRGLRLAKKKGKGRYIIYKEEMHGEIDEKDLHLTEEFVNSLGYYSNRDFSSTDENQIISEAKIYFTVGEIMAGLCAGVQDRAVIDECMEKLVKIYRLCGISLFMGENMERTATWGAYKNPVDKADYMLKESALKKFNRKNFFTENNVSASSFYLPEVNGKLDEHGITSTVHCILGTPENLRGLVTFDVEDGIRSWNENDANNLGYIAQILNKLL